MPWAQMRYDTDSRGPQATSTPLASATSGAVELNHPRPYCPPTLHLRTADPPIVASGATAATPTRQRILVIEAPGKSTIARLESRRHVPVNFAARTARAVSTTIRSSPAGPYKADVIGEVSVPALRGSRGTRRGNSSHAAASGSAVDVHAHPRVPDRPITEVPLGGRDVSHLSRDELARFAITTIGLRVPGFNCCQLTSALENVECRCSCGEQAVAPSAAERTAALAAGASRPDGHHPTAVRRPAQARRDCARARLAANPLAYEPTATSTPHQIDDGGQIFQRLAMSNWASPSSCLPRATAREYCSRSSAPDGRSFPIRRTHADGLLELRISRRQRMKTTRTNPPPRRRLRRSRRKLFQERG